MQPNKPIDYKSKSKQAKIKRAVFAVLALALIACLVAAIIHIKSVRAQQEEHIKSAALHIKEGVLDAAPTAVLFVGFYNFISLAEDNAAKINETPDFDEKMELFETIISFYEDAKLIAQALTFYDGIAISEEGTEKILERIIANKRVEALRLFSVGDFIYYGGSGFSEENSSDDKRLSDSLEYYRNALTLFMEIGDTPNMVMAWEKIDNVEHQLVQMNKEIPLDEIGSDATALSNYEHNLSIFFDMQTPIDHQRQSPASDILMGIHDGYNEGWYNGCGWIATYNALILLENPVHPAEIVKYFEENIGVIWGGMFGTYPTAVEDYLRGFGYIVENTTFPLLILNIDDVIKSSKVSILAYAHTSAAHYVTIKYREDIDKFIIYNDSFAKAYSESIGFFDSVAVGAAVDSVEAYIRNTSNILFAFSLITIN